MKKEMALLALTMSSALLADSSCCEPCNPCVPKPRDPICCECYSPAFYKMQCDWGLYIDGEFLYWYGRENGISYAAVTETVTKSTAALPLTASVPVTYEQLNTKWAPGFRIGLGWNMDDGWDALLNWTWYKNQKKDSTSVAAFTTEFAPVGSYNIVLPWLDNTLTLGAALGGGTGTSPYATPFQYASAHWHFNFNQVDLVMGRKYWLSKCFTMRPFAGLRGTWTETKFDISGTSNTTTLALDGGVAAGAYTFSALDKFTNKNWGVGLLAGFQPSFYFTDEFSLYAGSGVALLWGQFKSAHYSSYLNTLTATGANDINVITPTANDNFYGMQPMLDLELGLRWETSWCDERYMFGLDAGWEHHILFDHNTRVKPLTPAISGAGLDGYAANGGSANLSYDEVMTNVVFGGFVLRARFDF